ncbi:MAG TPA: hypothetical protein VKF14_07270 [Candidatus Dormibacteraeota bacterium]|nr:hypothetical protein [Candidatus Dormibacteraeota bacterium]
MAADLDLTGAPAVAPWPAFRRAVCALAGLGLFVVVLWLTGWAAVLLLGCLAAGWGLTYLTGLPLTLEERLAYGTVIGAVVLAVTVFLLAMAFGLSLATVLAALGLVLAVAALGWRRARGLLDTELTDALRRWRRLEPWPLWVLLGLSWPFTLTVLAHGYLFNSQGLVTQGAGFYADWAAHLTYAGSFAFGHNFPPEFPVDPGHPMAYPFMIDLLAAALVPMGTSLTSALVLSSGLLALAFPVVMYVAGLRLIRSRVGSALAVLVFALSGGLGFFQLFDDLRRSGLTALRQSHQLYTQDPARNLQWLNPVLAWMLPQRSVLFGFSLALLVMAMLWTALRREDGRHDWAPFVFAGVVTGLSPLCHLHGYGTVVALAAFWALFSRRIQWAGFFVPAIALGLPAVLWMVHGGAASIHQQLWWLANKDEPVWFWLKNTSLLLPAMAAAFLWRPVLPDGVGLYLAPIWLWFLVPNFLVFQPWDWDNTKFFAYWALFGALPVGALLAALLRRGLPARVTAYVMAVFLMLSGALDVGRALDSSSASALFTGSGGLQVAAWAREHTDSRAVFLVAPVHNEPIPTLAGRRVMVGYPGWLWTYGLADWATRTHDAQVMLKGDPATLDLLHRYRVDYVVLGPEDAAIQGSNGGYFDQIGQRVYSSGGYTVYRVR